MDLLRFVFSNFWIWLGFTIMISLIVGGMIGLVKACKPEKRRLETFRSRDILRVDIVGASDEEIKEAREEIVTAEWDGCKYRLKKDGNPEREEQGI